LRNSLYYKELAIFSEEPLETQPGFSEVPFMQSGKKSSETSFYARSHFLWPAKMKVRERALLPGLSEQPGKAAP
jgi:hypothetical protein